MRGYDPKQVDEYVSMLRDGYMEMERGYKELEAEKVRLEQDLEAERLRLEQKLESEKIRMERELAFERTRAAELVKKQSDTEAIARALIDAESVAKQITEHARLRADETLLLAKNEAARLLGEAKREMAQIEIGKRALEQQLRTMMAVFENSRSEERVGP
jgi:cell division septum initiation protein DivIVA